MDLQTIEHVKTGNPTSSTKARPNQRLSMQYWQHAFRRTLAADIDVFERGVRSAFQAKGPGVSLLISRVG
jgi:hypothetical protein